MGVQHRPALLPGESVDMAGDVHAYALRIEAGPVAGTVLVAAGWIKRVDRLWPRGLLLRCRSI